jgi:hypothetical protein
MGGRSDPQPAALESDLAAQLQRLGISEATAKVAAKG